ncbi:MAG: hypothetical protein BWY21_01653 [Parcubacteria group bacterium ADurb.Bin216]|nr:MAG: hypothetical protein BWY21_01653 [Parcubacteria group bacterium ADurb.Bin216]
MAKTKYTKQDLWNVRLQYRDNFDKLEKAVGTPSHQEFVKIERELHIKEVKIMKALGLWLSDPCPVQSTNSCNLCSGYYKVIRGKSKVYKTDTSMTKICDYNDKGAMRCRLKSIMGLE